jgi:hypothetical protein
MWIALESLEAVLGGISTLLPHVSLSYLLIEQVMLPIFARALWVTAMPTRFAAMVVMRRSLGKLWRRACLAAMVAGDGACSWSVV